ncbi:MAG: Com family DNA-binding transcriptional regulator [Zoogloeaceae bacterium]|nr:Com family DNA-binding transcriptional regulator [Zoogloeaceae bacterium]
MQDVRCGGCNRKLGEARAFDRLAIKCPRCKTLNHYTGFPAGHEPQHISAAGRVEDHDRAHQS